MGVDLPSNWILIAGFIVASVVLYLIWDAVSQAFSCCCCCFNRWCPRRSTDGSDTSEDPNDVEEIAKAGRDQVEALEAGLRSLGGSFTSTAFSCNSVEENPYSDFRFTGGVAPAHSGQPEIIQAVMMSMHKKGRLHRQRNAY